MWLRCCGMTGNRPCAIAKLHESPSRATRRGQRIQVCHSLLQPRARGWPASQHDRRCVMERAPNHFELPLAESRPPRCRRRGTRTAHWQSQFSPTHQQLLEEWRQSCCAPRRSAMARPWLLRYTLSVHATRHVSLGALAAMSRVSQASAIATPGGPADL